MWALKKRLVFKIRRVAFGVVVITAAAKNKLTGIASFFFGDWVSRRNGPQFEC
jgi:hypothetical protein